jgi:DNA invertase Pin-like site-specific DNA recombinase
MIHAYARVSTDGQSVDAQVRKLKAAGARKVWRETASGAKTDLAASSTGSTPAMCSW